MAVRIIAGTFGGRTVETPKGFVTHPMSDRIRSSLFNSLAKSLQGTEILDAFAGSGVMGLEALSRGAKNATFVERDQKASITIAENIAKLGVEDKTKIIKGSVSMWCDKAGKKYDIILADPPYNDMQLTSVKKLFGLLNNGGYLVLSYPTKFNIVEPEEGVELEETRSFGEASLAYYRKN